jgi:mono/diheme cytochrome c family protein
MRPVGVASSMFILTLILAISNAGPAVDAEPLDGRGSFRFDTFRDEQLWTDTFQLHEALETVTPAAALTLGLKVDADALPPPVIQAVTSGQLDIDDPKVTRRLLELNAVVGVVARIADDRVKSVGITCALCHSTVDDSLMPNIGRRLDGWPNLDLDVGKIVALAPGFPDALRSEFQGWGPGKYDPRHHVFDGTNIISLIPPDEHSLPVVIPAAYGLAGVGFETYTGDGPISYWNSYVGVTQMGGQGSFSDPRIGVSVFQKPDLVTPKLAALLAYQLSLNAPPPPPNSFNKEAASRGQEIFNGVGRCGTCHIPPTYTDVLTGPDPRVPVLHAASEVGADPRYAARSATGLYRTTPLRALWQHPPYFHDGSAADLLAVVNHYNQFFGLNLTDQQKADLVEFLKSL